MAELKMTNIQDVWMIRALKLEAEIERLRRLAKAILENAPDDMAADGITCLDVWRKEAKELVGP